MWRNQIYTHLCRTKMKETKSIYEIFRRKISSGPVLLLEHQNAFTPRDPSHRIIQNKKTIGPMGWFLLLVPITTLGLGTWQVKRRQWKLDLIADLKARTSNAPRELPYDLTELEATEYYPVRVSGEFDHSQELYMGPRSLIVDGDAATQSGLISKSGVGQSGFYVITPFHLADRDLTILVNRGWVPTQNKNPATRQEGQVEGRVELVGVVRLNERRAPFMPQNQPDSWFYRDLAEMAEATGAAPVFLDATAGTTVEHGPIGGQTRISMRNEHLSYVMTWYGLSIVTGFMWFRHFIHRPPVM